MIRLPPAEVTLHGMGRGARAVEETAVPIRSAVLFVVSVAIVPAAAAGQTSGAPGNTPASVGVGFDGGFYIQSDNGDNRLTFGMVAQTDGRFSTDRPAPFVDTFTLRKIRPTFTGRIAKFFDFKVMPDFGNGTAVVQDAYFDIRFSPKLRVRIGKDKTPIGYELLEGDAYLWFPERSLASSLVPNRDIGVQVQGDVAAGTVSYAAGLFNGVPDASSATTELDTNNSKDFAGRVTIQPFRRAAGSGLLNALGVQVGGSAGAESGALPAFRTSAQQTYFSYASSAAADGRRRRLSPAIFYYVKSVGVFAEYMRSTQTVTRDSATAAVANQAWDVSVSWLLTGEAASYTMIRPKREFDPDKGQWGAIQLLARYSQLSVDPAAFALGFAAAGASRVAHQFTMAANWYPSALVKF